MFTNLPLEERVDIEDIKTTIKIFQREIKEDRDLLDEAWTAYGAGSISHEEILEEEKADFEYLIELVCAHYGIEQPRKRMVRTEKRLIRYIYKNANPNYWDDEVDSNLAALGITEHRRAA